jgi:flagellin
MSLSFQTNVTSLVAENNLLVNSQFQSNTITQLTSGYRINSSGDDPAGLAVANGLRNQIAELTEGVSNANNGVAVLQTIDGGLNNISTILDTLTTLATQSASATFTGNRATVNNEYQSLLSEITRQATNIGLNNGGTYNTNVSVFIGGANTAANAQVNVNLAGANNAVDAASLGLSGTSVAGGGTSLTGNAVNLSDTAVQFLAGGSQTLTFNIAGPTGAATTVGATVSGGSGGLSGAQVIASLNNQLQASGITASIGTNGQVQFSGSTPFTLVNVLAASAGNAIVTTGSTLATNTANYNVTSAAYAAVVGTNEAITFQNANGSYNVSLSPAGTASIGATIQSLNTQLAGSGITAVLGGTGGTTIDLQSANAFSIDQTAAAGTSGGIFAGTGAIAVTAPAAGAGSTGNAQQALQFLATAVQNLGLVQGAVGSGESVMADAIGLANSQITNESAAESQIRDANIAQEAANLTKSQVLQQSSVAALAQANAAPETLLKLLQ